MSLCQIVVQRKAADATGLTAREAIQTLLGYGSQLAALDHRRIVEIELDGEAAGTAEAIHRYLGDTVVFWNPNRERAWVRFGGRSWEIVSGSAPIDAAFGAPPLESEDRDHLVLWNREKEGPPADLPRTIGPARRTRFHSAELYSFQWGEAGDEANRRRLLEGLAVVVDREKGLLVQPQYQDHRFVLGALPLGLWG